MAFCGCVRSTNNNKHFVSLLNLLIYRFGLFKVTLEARAGALCSMQAFLEYCAPAMDPSENVHRRLLAPLDCALNLLSQMPEIVRNFGSHLSQPAAVVRHRLYRCLALLPPPEYSGMLLFSSSASTF